MHDESADIVLISKNSTPNVIQREGYSVVALLAK